MGGASAGGRGGSAAVLLRSANTDCANYLEIARADPRTAAPQLRTILCDHEGIAMLVHATPDTDKLRDHLECIGLEMHAFHLELAPMHGGNPFTVDVLLPEPGQSPFMFNAVRYSDSSDFALEEWLQHPNTAVRWVAVTYIETDSRLAETLEYYARVYGQPASCAGVGSFTFQPRDVQLRIMAQTVFEDAYTHSADFRGRRFPFGAIIEVEVLDLEILIRVLDTSRVAYERKPGSVIVASEPGRHVLFEFVVERAV